jgi:serine/threonine protein kinase
MSNYRLLDRIEHCGMGEVFEAYRILPNGTRSRVACKSMRDELHAHPSYLDMFFREANLNLEISHNHHGLVSVHECIEDTRGRSHLIMELVEGCSLHDIGNAYGPPSWDALRLVARETLETLAYIHERDVIHRDLDAGSCAAAIIRGVPGAQYVEDGRVRIAFDGDAVLFDESSELRYKEQGIDKFHAYEAEHENEPLGDGPYAQLLRKLAQLQERLPTRIEYSPVRVSIVTARNAPSELRVIKTLRHWGVYVDEAYFLGGLAKAPVLQAIKPHIFFDDQDVHLDEAAKVVPSGKVPYASQSGLATWDTDKNSCAPVLRDTRSDPWEELDP